MLACTQGSANSQLHSSSTDIPHGSCSMQLQESRLLQLPFEIFKQILEAACHAPPDGLDSKCLHALYITCRPACHAMRQLIKHLKVDLDAPPTPVEEGVRQLALYPALNRLALSVQASSTALSDFMAGTKGTTARLTAVHTLSVDTCKLDITSEDMYDIVLALPSLRDVTLTGEQLPRCVKPLHWLAGLTRLDLNGRQREAPSDRDFCRDLGLLTGLQSLVIDCVEPSRLLPHLAQLPKLSHLEISVSFLGGPQVLVPEFSLLQHLTQLTWKGEEDPDFIQNIPPQTLDAICACTCLVELNLRVFTITTAAAVQQLVAMPKLKRVAINELPELREMTQPFECSWESLQVVASMCMRQLIPFSSVRHVRVDGAWWLLWGGGDAASMAAVAAEVTAVAKVLAHGHMGDLDIAWGALPAVSCSSVIGGLAPLRQLGSLILDLWVIDKALLLQMSEALPELASLTLNSGCTIEQGAWAAMHSLSCLTDLTVDCDVVRADVLAFAMAASRGLSMCVPKVADDTLQLASYRTIIQEHREALGKPPIRLWAPTGLFVIGWGPAADV